MEKKRVKLGATGKYPQGKLNKHDEGELKFAVGIKQNKIIIEFGKPISWLGMDKEQAIQIGQAIIDKANKL